MSIFSERMRETRKNKRLTQKNIADMLEIKQPSYVQWERGKRVPSIINATKIANILDVSLDYLVGRTSIAEVNRKGRRDKER